MVAMELDKKSRPGPILSLFRSNVGTEATTVFIFSRMASRTAKLKAPWGSDRTKLAPAPHVRRRNMVGFIKSTNLGLLGQIADHFGISVKTFQRVMERQPDVMTAYKKGKSSKIKYVASKLMDKINDGDLTAIIFFMKTQAGWTEKQAMELTSPDGTMTPTRIERVFVDPSND